MEVIMVCKYCGGKTRVTDSVPLSMEVFRKRQCDCHEKIYTVETEVKDVDEARLVLSRRKNRY